MSAAFFLVPMIIAIISSMLIVRAGAIALMMTGMNYDKSKFQALSAFSGTGFTTSEAERVVNNPTRRSIVSWLMILGNAGIVTVIVTASASFAKAKGLGIGLNIIIIVIALIAIITVARRSPIARHWERFVASQLSRHRAFDEDAPVDELLHLSEGYGVSRMRLSTESTWSGQPVQAVEKALEGGVVLGIERGQEWIAAPKPQSLLSPTDVLVVYGQLNVMANFHTHTEDGSLSTTVSGG